MENKDLAIEIVKRLNIMMSEDKTGEVCKVLQLWCEQRVPIDAQLAKAHPALQCLAAERAGQYAVGVLGILNGLIGVKANGWGWLAAVYDDGVHNLLSFKVTDE